MSTRTGASRSMGGPVQWAVIARGGHRCFGCQRRLRPPGTDGGRDTCSATIDHYDGDGHNHDPANLLPACRLCNNQRRWADTWEAQLGKHGQTPDAAAARARAQLAEPLDMDTGRRLADEAQPGRREACQRYRLTYQRRRAGLLPPVTHFP